MWKAVEQDKETGVSSRRQIVAQSASGRGRGDRNWGPQRKGPGTVSRDNGRKEDGTYGREYDFKESGGDGVESFGRGRGRGRGAGRGYRGRGSARYGDQNSSYSDRRKGSAGSGRGYRGSGHSSARGSGRRGGRYDALREAADKRMHRDAFEVVDEETGEKVVVWGIEDEDCMPRQEDLKWKPTTIVAAGDVSEESWYKAMEASMDGPSGAFSIKGVRQGGAYADEDDDDDVEDDVYESDYDDDDDDEEDDEFGNELTANLVEEPEVVKPVRSARIRVFGRDYKQKDSVVSESSEGSHSGRHSVTSLDGAVGNKSHQLPMNGVNNSQVLSSDVDQSWPLAGQLVTGKTEDGYDSTVPSSSNGAGRKSQRSSLSEFSSVDSVHSEEDADQQWPPVGTLFSAGSSDSSPSEASDEDVSVRGDESSSSAGGNGESLGWPPAGLVGKGGVSSDEVSEASFESESTNERSQRSVWKDVKKVVREEEWVQGGMNPGIIDVDDDGDDEYESRRVADRKSGESVPVRSSLLDELRLQTQRKLASKTVNEDVEKVARNKEMSRAQAGGRSEEESSNVTVVKPRGFRDLKARSNYDSSLAAEFFSTKSLKGLGASEEVIGALSVLQIRKPSAIQAMAFKPILDGQSCIVADQTGSGKTLAYLAPLVQKLRAEEEKGGSKQLNKKPRVLVLAPTSELAVQILNVCRAFSRGGAPFRSLVLTGGFKWKTQVESLAQGADVVIATPGRFLQHLEKGSLKLDNLTTVVLDEVDILYDDQEFTAVLQTLEQAASRRVQYVHVTATLPLDIHDSLLTRYPDAIPLMGPTLHRTAVGLQEVLVDCSQADGEEKTPEKAFLSKKAALLQLVDQRPVSKTIIFCNKIETCRDVENALYRHDRNGTKLTVLPYHAALSQEARLESMQQFLESQPSKSLFLVCTDRASRGLDSFDVEHVILFDFPRDPSEYVRRVGRTARGAGGTGKVFVFALGKQVAMARRIMARNEKGRPIHDIPGTDYET